MNKKEQIIRTAMKLFVQQGFENTGTEQISLDANVAKGTLFYHFKTKEILISQIYLYVKKSMMSSILKNFDETSEIKEKIKSIWTNLIKWGFHNKDENMFLSRFYGSTYIRNLTLDEINSDLEKAKKIFEEAVNSGLIKNYQFDLFERITMSLYQSFLPDFYRVNKVDNKLLELSFETYWDAISKK